MGILDALKKVGTRETPQSEKIVGSTQVPNSAGGFSWKVTDEVRLDRFLILGTEGGSYYSGERALTLDNAEAVLREAGMSLSNVVRLNFYTTDVGAFFGAHDYLVERSAEAGCRTASTLLGVARLAFPEMLVELEATAVG